MTSTILLQSVAAFVVAGLISLVLTPLAIRAALRLGVLDRPGEHKSHTTPTPYLGGVAIVLAVTLSIALAADLRIAAERSVFVSAFSTIGGSGDFGSSWFLPRLIGEARAKELMFMSPRLTASDALGLGLVNRVVPDDDFADAALAFCHELAGRAPVALRYMKENIQRSFDSDLATALDAEAVAMVRSMSTADHREAVAAFLEKRSATFEGR